jgi:hypothetical protein
MARPELQFWRHSGASASMSAGVSSLVHATLIAASVWATLPSPDDLEPPDADVWYMPPPDPKPNRTTGSAETIQYVALAPEGPGSGLGAEGSGVELDAGRSDDRSLGNIGRDSVTSVEEPGVEGSDSVFTIIEVDSAATRLPESAAPKYPKDLLERRVQGQAIVQFVVDTTGFADPASFSVVLASHPDFVASVREALPGMRFSTAKIGSVKVRQLVELPFTFHIADPPPVQAESTTARTATKRPRPQ